MRVDINDAALEDLLNSPDGPVGRFLIELSLQATATAKALVPTLKPGNLWNPLTSSAYGKYPGYTRERIRPHFGVRVNGQIFSGVNAPYGPTLFLQRPAEQLHERYAFLSDALDSLAF